MTLVRQNYAKLLKSCISVKLSSAVNVRYRGKLSSAFKVVSNCQWRLAVKTMFICQIQFSKVYWQKYAKWSSAIIKIKIAFQCGVQLKADNVGQPLYSFLASTRFLANTSNTVTCHMFLEVVTISRNFPYKSRILHR